MTEYPKEIYMPRVNEMVKATFGYPPTGCCLLGWARASFGTSSFSIPRNSDPDSYRAAYDEFINLLVSEVKDTGFQPSRVLYSNSEIVSEFNDSQPAKAAVEVWTKAANKLGYFEDSSNSA